MKLMKKHFINNLIISEEEEEEFTDFTILLLAFSMAFTTSALFFSLEKTFFKQFHFSIIFAFFLSSMFKSMYDFKQDLIEFNNSMHFFRN